MAKLSKQHGQQVPGLGLALLPHQLLLDFVWAMPHGGCCHCCESISMFGNFTRWKRRQSCKSSMAASRRLRSGSEFRLSGDSEQGTTCGRLVNYISPENSIRAVRFTLPTKWLCHGTYEVLKTKVHIRPTLSSWLGGRANPTF
ncbi:hypothetical protein K402DRAFT_38894 [Aulographum hederae CBS 113979]|uniref:Uncharacterized protein n=1 Tax=Aulographum hederae CBS 113979 TaxID=1176131 RepID=A0A6G1H461_9PEZI|nr:hypothetical protein K402DRAFT_38894 [Aulographum hederae CBS 113979]